MSTRSSGGSASCRSLIGEWVVFAAIFGVPVSFDGNQPEDRRLSSGKGKFTVTHNQEFLLYPLDTGEDPACLGCGAIMMVAGQEVGGTNSDFITFRCERCGRTEKYMCE